MFLAHRGYAVRVRLSLIVRMRKYDFFFFFLVQFNRFSCNNSTNNSLREKKICDIAKQEFLLSLISKIVQQLFVSKIDSRNCLKIVL